MRAVALGLDVAVEEADRRRRRRARRRSPPTTGWKRSMCRRSQSPCALPVLGHARRAARAGPQRNASRSRQSGHSSSRSSGPMRPMLAGELLVQPEAGMALVEARAARRRRSRRRRCARSAGARRRRASSRARERAQHAHDRRDAAAGADEEQLLGQRVGQREDALDAAEADDRPGLAPGARGSGETLPSSTSLGVMLMQPSGRPGSEVSE